MCLSISNLLLRSNKRIGPHNINILSIIFGSLLGDGYIEKHGNGTRICFYQEGSHKDYLLWLHKLIADLNYTNPVSPKLTTRLGNYGKLRQIIRFNTFTYSSFNWIYENWHNKKLINYSFLEIYLTPLALAIWIMDDGCKSLKGMKLATNNFTLIETIILSNFLNQHYKLNTTINSAGRPNEYVIYISYNDKKKIWSIVHSYIHPSMKYKFY
jgi:ubiquinol-cytochrome c reductase cytochrome b subunit